MKKTALILVCILLGFSSPTVEAQIKGTADYLVKYEVSFAIDSTEKSERTTEMHSLYTGSSVSYYASDLLLSLDSIMTKFRENPRANMKRMQGNFKDFPKPEFMARVYKDLQHQKALVEARILRDQYIYEEPNLPIEWEMSDESKQIGEYTAQKATTKFGGRTYEAWFTLQVPIQDGPFIFSGLPGLILEISDDADDYTFKVTSIKPLPKSVEINSENEDFKPVDKAKFIKAYQNYRENPLGPFAETIRKMKEVPDPTTGKMLSGKELLRKANKEIKKRNNYIEKW